MEAAARAKLLGRSRDGGRSPSHPGPAPSPHLCPVPSLPQAPSVPPPLPAKASSLAAARGLHGDGAAPEGPYTRVRKAAGPPEPPDAKYQQLLCFHTYAESRECVAAGPSACVEPEEPLPFYAMGRGSSPSAGSEENIYSEVALARQDLPRGSQGAFSTLPPKSRTHRRLFRSASSQASKRRQLPAAPTAAGRERGAFSPTMEVSSPPKVTS